MSSTQGTVAIVDDEQNLRENVGLALRREGYRTETFSDGQAAWQAFQGRLVRGENIARLFSSYAAAMSHSVLSPSRR